MSGSASIWPDRHARIERRVRVLEDDLHRAPLRAQLARRRARRGRGRRTTRCPRSARAAAARAGRWSTCRSPTRRRAPSVSPAASAKSTPSTARTTPSTRPKMPLRTGKCLTRPSARSSARHAAAPRLVERRAPARGQRDARRDVARAAAPRAAALGCANGQRGMEAAAARAARADSGTWPSIAASRVAARGRSRGIEPEQADRVRMLRLGEQRRHAAPARRCGRRTSRPRRRRARRPRPGRA